MKLNQKSIDTLRVLSAEMISAGKAGDPGIALSGSPILFALFKDHYNFYGGEKYVNRDRFVLSAGSMSATYYALMHMFGLDISGVDLKKYTQFESRTPYSPELDITEGIDSTSGQTGQGVATAVGLAISQALLAEKFNVQKFEIINNHTYCFVSDECLMSGVAQEAISLAGTLKLRNLILLYNSTSTTNDGNLNQINNEKIKSKFKAMGWKVITVYNGNSYLWNTFSILRAKRSLRPTLIIFKTKVGHGTAMAGNYKIHNKVLGHNEIEKMKADYNMNGSFNVSNEVKQFCMRTSRRLKVKYSQWERIVVLYKNTHPELAEQLNAFYEKPKIAFLKVLKGRMEQTEDALEFNRIILNHIASVRPCLMGGNSNCQAFTKVCINDKNFSKTNYRGRNILFGARNSAMGSVCNGISLYFGAPTFCSTLFSNSNMLLPSIRLSAQMTLPVLYIFTHDSIFDAPYGKLMPTEQLSQLRAIPNFTVFRPADNSELLACHSVIYESECPSALVISKNLQPYIENSDFEQAKKGAYIISEDADAEIILFASGAEVKLALEAKNLLNKTNKKVCVVSVPSIELFERQQKKLKNQILKQDIKIRVAVEASNDKIWYKYIGFDGLLFNVNSYGKSGNELKLKENLNFTAKNLVNQIKSIKPKN